MATAKEVLAQLAALAGEDEAIVGANNTTVNRYFNAVGYAYCGYAIWYAVKKAGSSILDGCANPAYVPTIKAYLAGRGWQVDSGQPRAGDIFAYKDQHVGFVYEPISGSTVLTLEGNSTGLRATAAAARTGTGASYEGIGYRRRTLGSGFTLYRPAYDGAAAGGDTCTVLVDILRTGSAGCQVRTVQRLLNAGAFTGADGRALEEDGRYGANTAAAVKKFQRAAFPGEPGEWDGQVGTRTWSAMLKEEC